MTDNHANKLLFLLKSKSAYQRVTMNLPENAISPYLADMFSFHQWLQTQRGIAAALVDPKWPDYVDVIDFLTDRGVPWVNYAGQAHARRWLTQYLPSSEIPPVGLPVIEPMKETTSQGKDEGTVPRPHSSEDIDVFPDDDSTRTKATTSDSKIEPEKQTSSAPSDAHFDPMLSPVQYKAQAVPPVPIRTIRQPTSDSVRYVERIVEVEKPVYIQSEPQIEPMIEFLSPRLIVVMALWNGAGASFVSNSVAYLLAEHLRQPSVTLIEAPQLNPSMWHSLDLDFHSSETEPYLHWSQTPISSAITRESVELIPLNPEQDVSITEDQLMQFVYRKLRHPFVIVDVGSEICPQLLETADHVLLVMDSNPVKHRLFDPSRLADYLDSYPAQVLFNKWVTAANFKMQFPVIKVPYISPEIVQEVAWRGDFPTANATIKAAFQDLRHELLDGWLPNVAATRSKSIFFWRNRK